jgi:hypothetical protein
LNIEPEDELYCMPYTYTPECIINNTHTVYVFLVLWIYCAIWTRRHAHALLAEIVIRTSWNVWIVYTRLGNDAEKRQKQELWRPTRMDGSVTGFSFSPSHKNVFTRVTLGWLFLHGRVSRPLFPPTYKQRAQISASAAERMRKGHQKLHFVQTIYTSDLDFIRGTIWPKRVFQNS